jgi:hypothetical protein
MFRQKFGSHFVLDPHWVVGMGVRMKSQNTPSSRWKIIDRIGEPPPAPQPKLTRTERPVVAASTPEKKPASQWRNLTLDELRAWLVEAKRRQQMQEKQQPECQAPGSGEPAAE